MNTSGEAYDSKSLGQLKTTIPETGDKVCPSDIIEQGVDAIKYPLMMANNLNKGEGKKSDKIFFKYSYMFMNLGIIYSLIEQLWKDALWGGSRVVTKNKLNVIFPTKMDVEKNKVISAFRREQLNIAMTALCFSHWKDIPNDIKERYCPVITIKRKGKKKNYILSYAPFEHPPTSFVNEIIASDLYLINFKTKKLPKLNNITINSLLKVKSILSALAETMYDRFPENNSVYKLTTLEQFNCTVDLKKIEKIVQNELQISNERARYLLERFTFSWNTREDLWLKPIIKTDDKTYLLIEPLLSGNILRDIEHWMKIGGLDVASRGKKFEKFSREKLKESIESSKILEDAFVVNNDFKLYSNDSYEEIDIIIGLGKKIIICEAKCNLFPTEPSDYKNYFSDLEYAAEQAKRKITFILNNIEKFVEKIDSQYENPHEIEFIPLVLTNLPLGVGLNFDGASVVDNIILSRYFEDGFYEVNVPFDGVVKSKLGTKIFFYKNNDDAIKNIENYLINPPQLAELKKNISANMRTIPFGPNGTTTKFITFEVNINNIEQPII